jgi:hypothetical protein
MSIPMLCFFSFITGLGSSAAFGAAIKVGKQLADSDITLETDSWKLL